MKRCPNTKICYTALIQDHKVPDRISRAERERQNEIKRQKEFFLQIYRKVQDREKVCDELRLSEHTIITWLNEDPDFYSLYNRVTLQQQKPEDIDKIRREQVDDTLTLIERKSKRIKDRIPVKPETPAEPVRTTVKVEGAEIDNSF